MRRDYNERIQRAVAYGPKILDGMIHLQGINGGFIVLAWMMQFSIHAYILS